MEFALDSFEHEIDAQIVARGRAYYREGAVIRLEEKEEGMWESLVAGNSMYDVSIEMADDEVVNYGCDCPYDWGGPCKHIVAVLFAIRDELTLRPIGTRRASHAARGEADSQTMARVDQVMAELDAAELLAFLRAQLQQEQQLAQQFLTRFEGQGKLNDPVAVPQMLQRKLDGALSLRGKAAIAAWDGIEALIGNVLDRAEEWVAEADPAPAIRAIGACIKTALHTETQYELRTIGLDNCVTRGWEIFNRIVKNGKTTTATRTLIFEQCLALGNMPFEKGGVNGRRLYDFAASLMDVVQDGERIIALFDKLKAANCLGEAGLEMRLDLARKWGGPEAETAYIQANLSRADVREVAVARAIAEGDYALATQLAQIGQQYAQNGSREAKVESYKLLVKVAVMQRDLSKAIQYAINWFNLDYYPSIQLYKSIKAAFPAEDWPAVSEALTTSKSRRPALGAAYLAEIYKVEGWHDRLLALLQKEASPYLLQSYETALPQAFRPALVGIWERILTQHLENCTSRPDYVMACRYLNTIRRLGGHEVFAYMKKFIEEEFKRRPAFMEELRKL